MTIKENVSIRMEAYAYAVSDPAKPLTEFNAPFDPKLLDYLIKLCEVNGCAPFEYDRDPIVHLQWASKDILGITIRNERIQIRHRLIVDFSYLDYVPLKVLAAKNAREGMTADIVIPVGEVFFRDRSVPAELTMETTFRQVASIYGPVGGYTRFEQALDCVTSHISYARKNDHGKRDSEVESFENFLHNVLKIGGKKPVHDDIPSSVEYLHRSLDWLRQLSDDHDIAVITAAQGGPKDAFPFSEDFIKKLLREPCEPKGMFIIDLSNLGGDIDG